jgi:hypothetical protein
LYNKDHGDVKNVPTKFISRQHEKILRKPKNKVINKTSRSDNTIGATYWLIVCLQKKDKTQEQGCRRHCALGDLKQNKTNKLPSFLDRFQIL